MSATRRLFIVVGVAGLAAGLFFLMKRSASDSEPAAVLVATAGRVEVNGQPAVAGALLERGSTVRAVEGAACWVMQPGARGRLGAGTVMKVLPPLELVEGQVFVSQEPQPSGGPLRVASRAGESVTANGAFSIDATSAEEVWLRVWGGAVSAEAKGRAPVQVAAGQAIAMGDSAVRPLRDDAAAAGRAMLRACELWTTQASALLEVQASEAGAAVVIDTVPVGLAPVTLLLPAGPHDVQIRRRGSRPHVTTVALKANDRVVERATLEPEVEEEEERVVETLFDPPNAPAASVAGDASVP